MRLHLGDKVTTDGREYLVTYFRLANASAEQVRACNRFTLLRIVHNRNIGRGS